MSDTLRRLGTALLLIAAVCGTGCSKPDYTTLQGEQGRFSDHRGRWVLINYWADWCKPCIKELPELNEFQRRHGERATMFVVNFDGIGGEALKAQVERLAIETPVLLQDPAPALGFERPKALPTTFVFGPDDTLRQTLQGPQTLASLSAAIEH